MSSLGRGCVKTLFETHFGGLQTITRVPIFDPGAHHSVEWFRGDPTSAGHLLPAADLAPNDTGSYQATVTDGDGDSCPDVVATGRYLVQAYLQDCSSPGSFPEVRVLMATGDSPFLLNADVTADGRPDLLTTVDGDVMLLPGRK